jgi:phospholipid/cholesterol/gamma-HCH transport system ATP-binding protein
VIEVRNIFKSFDQKEVLKDVSVTFQEGKINFIIGRSGSGKSVLTKCVVGLLEVDAGTVLYHNRDFTHMDRKSRKEIRQEIGMLFQGSALFDSLNVEENVMFPLTMFTSLSRREMMKRVDSCLERVALPHTKALFPSELSGGMMKRVGIARAIAMNPKYLFVDEPNSGLDPQTAIVIDNLIKEITTDYNITTVISTFFASAL